VPRPCAVIQPALPAAYSPPALTVTTPPIAEDGSVLSWGVKQSNKMERTSFSHSSATARQSPRILTRSPSPPRTTTCNNNPAGLAQITIPEDGSSIPTSRETETVAISNEELRREQGNDPECRRFLSTATRGDLYDLNQDAILIRVAPSDGSHQVVIPKSLVARPLY
jgi:hypothetical protein